MRRRLCAPFCALLLALLGGLAGVDAAAQDLPVAADGGHLWLVTESSDAEGETVQVYHRGPGDEPNELRALDPIPGRLRPGGVAAGGGRLVLVMEDGRVLTRTPHHPPMGWGWADRSGTLSNLPEGCGLRSFAATDHAVWALVRVDSAVTLATLDAPPGRATRDWDERLSPAIGLPPGVDFRGPARPDATDSPGDDAADASGDDAGDTLSTTADETGGDVGAGSDGSEPSAEPGDGEPDDADPDPDPDPALDAAEPAPSPQASVPALPVYRLIRLGAGGWRTVPLPADFGQPRRAELVIRGASDERPAIVVESSRGFRDLVLVLPLPAVEGEDAPGWSQRTYRMPGGSPWSATAVEGQVIVGVERERSAQQVLADTYLLRAGRAVPLAMLGMRTEGAARWRLVAHGGEAVMLARPEFIPSRKMESAPEPELVAAHRLSVASAQPAEQIDLYYTAKRSRWEANADWLIQIVAFTVAMVLMMLFWKRTPYGREVRLPPDVRLVPWPRRITAALIDLLPGLWVVGGLYGLGWDVILLQHWPGTPIPKPPAAMVPGWIVIGVTVAHTTCFEFITARSVGKWLTGTYVSDFRGRPAPPGASLVRAVMRVFDLVAWLLLLLPIISPYRQRLGDILAKTLVVMRDPPEPDEQEGAGD